MSDLVCMGAGGGNTAVLLEGISKKYALGQRYRYATLRDSLAAIPGLFKARRARRDCDGGAGDSTVLWALKDVNLSIAPGESVGLIGRNGAGKSTLLKLLARVTAPTEGRGCLRGRVASLLEVGTGFHPELTGRDNIFLNGSILGMPLRDIRSRFDEIVEFAGLSRFIDTPVKRYSSGMYMRLAFAVAAHLDADIMLVDEVLAVGDAEFQKKCLGRMDQISRGGRTIIFVSHNMAAVRQLCTRGIVLASGSVVFDGRIDEATDHYLQRANTGGAVVWPDNRKPGNSTACLEAIRVLVDEKPTGDVAIDSALAIEVEFSVLQLDAPISVSIHLRYNDGTCVFATSNLPSMIDGVDPLAGKKLQPGRYRAKCMLPPLFLNEGLYSVTPFLVHGAAEIIATDPDAITLNVYDTGVMRAEYAGPWIGVIRPRLKWQTSFDSALG